jgi:SAM-dependent methyltransferase
MTNFQNVYEDEHRARAYAELGYPGTYFLAFRDIPQLLQKHVSARRALDFGCGAGRSTRFLRDLGFDATGIDISQAMLREAASRDPHGNYVLVRHGLHVLGQDAFDLILCAFPFDNIPARDRVGLFRQLAERLAPAGRIVNLVSSAEIYVNEWLSFSTRDFPENRHAKSGEIVRIVMLDGADQRPVEDVLWTDDDYAQTFSAAGLKLLELHRPLGKDSDPFEWVSERTVSPWRIHVLCRAPSHGD